MTFSHYHYVMRLVYTRPLLEFNSVIWPPRIKQNIDFIEKVQRRFAKCCTKFGYVAL